MKKVIFLILMTVLLCTGLFANEKPMNFKKTLIDTFNLRDYTKFKPAVKLTATGTTLAVLGLPTFITGTVLMNKTIAKYPNLIFSVGITSLLTGLLLDFIGIIYFYMSNKPLREWKEKMRIKYNLPSKKHWNVKFGIRFELI